MKVWMQLRDGDNEWCKQIDVPALPPVGCRIVVEDCSDVVVESVEFWDEFFVLNVKDFPGNEDSEDQAYDDHYPAVPACETLYLGWLRGPVCDHCTYRGPGEADAIQPAGAAPVESN